MLKYGGPGQWNESTKSYNGNPVGDYSTSDPNTYNSEKYNSVNNTGQYMKTSGAVISGAGQVYGTYKNPSSTIENKYDSTGNAVSGVAGAINPYVGMAIGLGHEIGKPIRNKLEETNDDGSYKNKLNVEMGALASITDGATSAGTFAGNGIWTPDQYANKTEQENMDKVKQQKQADLQNQQSQSDYNNMMNFYKSQQVNQVKYGGSIHINPENKGKFNATKERTGKSTEELTHSSNPLTRKRAIFAQNASKWKHEFGGNLDNQGTEYKGGFEHEDKDIKNVNQGIPIGNKNVVEKGEFRFKDYVFSDKLFIK